jgi:hypothetical protein
MPFFLTASLSHRCHFEKSSFLQSHTDVVERSKTVSAVLAEAVQRIESEKDYQLGAHDQQEGLGSSIITDWSKWSKS